MNKRGAWQGYKNEKEIKELKNRKKKNKRGDEKREPLKLW